jgi:hypothetical protein
VRPSFWAADKFYPIKVAFPAATNSIKLLSSGAKAVTKISYSVCARKVFFRPMKVIVKPGMLSGTSRAGTVPV